MIKILKQYATALIFLLITTIVMLAGTMAVMSLGENMVAEMGIEMNPRGEDLNTRGENK